ncbi:MAG: efflux RND transporter periplasmic adaptor subunit [Pirellulales bacterium]|nr:efflux RND transporter periplasmic adaptor subunit [Pirellulales bacterium]
MNAKIWIGIIVVAVILLVVGMSSGRFNAGAPVEAAAIERGAINEFIDEQAKTRLPETYLVTMPFPGRIEAIELTEGMPVKKDQVVARIVPRDLDLSVEEATAAVQSLEESIKENSDINLEETAYKQALQFVASTAATVQAAYERLRSGRAKLDFAARNFERIETLAKQKASTKEQLDAAELQKVQGDVDYQQDQLVHKAMVAMAAATNLMPTMVEQYIERKKLGVAVLKKQKEEAEARLRQILKDKARSTMRSPVEGVVLARSIANERYLPAGTTLLEIGRLEDMEVEADVLTLDVVAAKVGDAVEIYGPAIGKPTARGKVARIFPAGFTKVSSLGVEQQRVKVIVRFEPEDLKRLLNERGLGVGYRVRIKITTRRQPTALLAPRSALFRATDGTWRVYAVRGGAARLQDVEVGLMNDERVEIVAGLAEGEQVVLAPESSLTDGTRVRVK